MDDIKGEDGGVWGRKGGKQLTAHQDAASNNWGQSNQTNNVNNIKQ